MISTVADLRARTAVYPFIYADKQAGSGTASSAGAGQSLWRIAPTGSGGAWQQGAVPVNEAVDRNTVGAYPIPAISGTRAFITSARLSSFFTSSASESSYLIMLMDRLVQTAGLNATLTTEQTVNTAALTRFTSGEGVNAYIEVYTNVGGTSASGTMSYTNQAGTAGRTGTFTVGGTSRTGVGSLERVNLQTGDTGVRSVQSITLAGSTGTAGSFGITLARSIGTMLQRGDASQNAHNLQEYDWLNCGLAEFHPDACIWPIRIVPGNGSPSLALILSIAVD